MTVFARLDVHGCGCDAAQGLASIDQALERIRALPRRKDTEDVPLAKAMGRVLARPVTARANVPPFASSAMDGYALCAGDLIGDGPWVLPVSARIAAGDDARAPLPPGHAARIFTGGAVPGGADCVVMQEAVTAHPGRIEIRPRPSPGQNVRAVADDMGHGDVILPAGRRLTARDIAAAAASGRASVTVTKALRVALLLTGNEIVPQRQDLAPGQIWDVNGPMMIAMLTRPDVEITARAVAEDDADALTAQIAALADMADLLITSGGISVGDTDLVKPSLLALGGTIHLSGVAIKPGKPVSVGTLGRTAWLGLPGNPVSVHVIWQVFGTALLDHLTGRQPVTARRHAVLADPLEHKLGRCEMRPALLAGHDANGREMVRFESQTHSARVAMLARADGLILIPAEADQMRAGDLVEFLPFET